MNTHKLTTLVISKTVRWPSFTQSIKGVFTSGLARSWRYAAEKRAKANAGSAEQKEKSDLEKVKEDKKSNVAAKAEKEH